MRTFVTLLALAAFALTGVAGAQIVSQDSRVVCIPPAVVQALS
jgi:hypothetical protein